MLGDGQLCTGPRRLTQMNIIGLICSHQFPASWNSDSDERRTAPSCDGGTAINMIAPMSYTGLPSIRGELGARAVRPDDMKCIASGLAET